MTAVDQQTTTIPLTGLYSFAGLHKLFLVDQGTAREVQVRLGEQSREWVEISSPELRLDSLVVTSGQRLLSDGMPISIRKLDAEGIDSASVNDPSTHGSRQ